MSSRDPSLGDPSLLTYPPLPPSSMDNDSGHTPTLAPPSQSTLGMNQQLIDLGINQPTLDTPVTTYPTPTSSAQNQSLFHHGVGSTSASYGAASLSEPFGTNASLDQPLYAGSVVHKGPPLDSLHNQHSALHSMYSPRPQGGVSTTDPQTTNPNLQLRLQYVEQLCSKLQKENKTHADNFGRQRKKFMDKILEMEAERSLLSNTIERYSKEIREISTHLLTKDEELKNVTMAAKFSETQTKEDFDADRVKYEEEIASLRQILTVQSQEHQAAFNLEREAWKKERDGLLRQHHLSLSQGDKSIPVRPVALTPNTPVETTPSRQTSSPSPEGENLEFDMAKAAQDTKLLRSVVVPLEEEISFLKIKLRETQEQLASDESRDSAKTGEVSSTPPLIDFDISATAVPEGSSPTESETITQLQHQLKLERSARHDLEMHTEALVLQKTATHQEILALTNELKKLKESYETERNQHADLKKTWELANQHFVVAQDRLQQHLYTVKQELARQVVTSPTAEEASSPTITISGEGGESGEAVKIKHMTIPRSHRRSQSSEGGETPLPGSLQKRLSCSLPLIDQAGESAITDGDNTEVFMDKLSSFQQEIQGLQDELERRVTMCDGYESQLHRVQNQMVEEMDEKERDIDRLRAEIEKLKAGVMRERESQKKLRREITEQVEQIKVKMDKFRDSEKRVKQELRMNKDKFTELKHDTQREIARLTEERIELHKQLESSKEEYDCLKVLQAQQMGDYQQTLATEQTARKEAEINLKTTMNQLAAVQARLASTEEDLCAQLALVKEQLLSETQQKEKITGALTSQLESSIRENVGLSSLKADIQTERKAREDALASKVAIQEKSTTFIQSQQKQIFELHKEKETQEKQIGELQRQLSSLKHQLDRTAETQKDFVELSQSLQMRLVEMEESQSSNSPDQEAS